MMALFALITLSTTSAAASETFIFSSLFSPGPKLYYFLEIQLPQFSKKKKKKGDDQVKDAGIKAALSMLKFYKIVAMCQHAVSSMEAYKKYGVLKGTVLTAWRLCRCNPLGGSGFDPPRWFDEANPPEQ